tara:strand:+ start:326 stop:577 length:252 start_codon:yes stop_codon:yes gene_type:complete
MFSWTTHPTLKSTFTSIRGGNWELTHDQAGIVYLKGWGDDYCEKKEVEQMKDGSVLIPALLDEMESAWMYAFLEAVKYWKRYN